ncbi:MAG: M23 family metallopeptidase [Clostridia bacterium]|nr:M23 family metallopeptidase [Clostridia bacterium]
MIYRSPFKEKSRQTTAFKKQGNWKLGYHTGVDRVCDTDRTLVAICDGVVTRTSGCGKSYGNHVVYRTADGKCVLYAHLKSKADLPVGAKVKAGQKLGTMGNTGNSSGAHLHIEIQNCATWGYGKNLLDPNEYIDWNDFTQEGDFTAKIWKNGSTAERVYQTVADCKAKKNHIGSLSPREAATCTAIVDGCYLLTYSAGTTTKCGFVAYSGGV